GRTPGLVASPPGLDRPGQDADRAAERREYADAARQEAFAGAVAVLLSAHHSERSEEARARAVADLSPPTAPSSPQSPTQAQSAPIAEPGNAATIRGRAPASPASENDARPEPAEQSDGPA